MLPRKIQVGLALALGLAVLLALVSPAVPSLASVTQSNKSAPVVHALAILTVLLFAAWILLPVAAWPPESEVRASGPELIDFTCSRLC